MTATKPFTIPKRLVYDAWKAVKANAGSAGVDKETIDGFEADLKNNLYRIWNRMSSGSYFPPPVKAVAIPKMRWIPLVRQLGWRVKRESRGIIAPC